MIKAGQPPRGVTAPPVEYENALRSLQLCQTLDDAKYWSDKSEALAAWARIFRDKRVELEAKKLRLTAYRKMGELAQQLRPKQKPLGGKGCLPGEIALLKDQGLSLQQANSASFLARLAKPKFTDLLNRTNPPSPITAIRFKFEQTSEWLSFKHNSNGGMYFRGWTRNHPAAKFIAALRADEKLVLLEVVVELAAWVEEVGDWADEVLHKIS